LVNIYFKGQFLNSSRNKGINTNALATTVKHQFENVFNTSFAKDKDGPTITVTATAEITSIDNKDQLAKDATLFDVRDSEPCNDQKRKLH